MPLRQLAAARHIDLGAAVSAGALHDDKLYRKWLASEFNLLSTENALKFGPLRPTRDSYDFRDADAIVNFGERHGQRVRGHTLVWKRQLPKWLVEGTFSRAALTAILREHIQTVVGRYRGRVYAWDVVNEVLADRVPERPAPDSVLRPTLWLKGMGPQYIELAFRWAHEADPYARLFYNEAGIEEGGPKSDAAYALLSDLLGRGVPVNGVGFQMHTSLLRSPDTARVARSMARFAQLGLEIQVTEMDVAFGNAPGTESEKLAAQATIYREVLGVCLATPRCTAFVMWGMTDRYSWRYADTPLILDRTYQPKPAYEALKQALLHGGRGQTKAPQSK